MSDGEILALLRDARTALRTARAAVETGATLGPSWRVSTFQTIGELNNVSPDANPALQSLALDARSLLHHARQVAELDAFPGHAWRAKARAHLDALDRILPGGP